MQIKNMLCVGICFLFLSGISVSVGAQTVDELLTSAAANYKAGKYIKALEDLDWAKREISNKHLKILKKLLPEKIEGFTTRDVDGGAMMGIHSVSRKFVKGDKSVKVTITGDQETSPASGLGAIMSMAAKFNGMDAGTESHLVTVKGRRGQFNLETSDNRGTLTFTLKSNAFVTIETQGYSDSSQAKSIAEKLDFDAIETAFQ